MAFAIDDLIAKDTFDLSGFGPLINGIKFNGSIYGLPVAKSAWVLFYNKDLFNANGVGYPSKDMTWEEFGTLAKKMTTGVGAEKVWVPTFTPGLFAPSDPDCRMEPQL
ncbi:MAG: extracellular solute-binding protein [Bacteroidales bacterium]